MNIYVSQELWKKFRELAFRDRMSMSGLIEGFIKDWVHRKDPGNPQRPLTAYVEGHEDQEKLLTKGYLEDLHGLAIYYCNVLPLHRIVSYLKVRGVKPLRRKAMADALAYDLNERGIKIQY